MPEKDTCLAIENAVQQLEQAPDILQEKLKPLRIGLRSMSLLIKDFDGQEYEPEIADWLRTVKEIAYETQEVIGSVVADTNIQKEKSKLGRLLSGQRVIKHHRAEDINNIEKRIQRIHSVKDAAGSIKESRHGHTNSEINMVVGFEDVKETLVRQLISKAKPQSNAILIFGKAGSGKTTLAKLIYNDVRIKEHFGFRLVWVHLPQELSFEELLSRILKQFSHTGYQTDFHLSKELNLKAELSYRKGQKYLIVIDSMNNCEVWNELMSYLPENLNGSRIVLTSRLTPAALCVHPKFSYETEPLNITQSWELLSRKIFEPGNCPSELENLGGEMAGKCKGSPRAILALAAILVHVDKTVEMWSKFLKDYHDLSNYHDLPTELKLCLLYFGLFPVGLDIPAKQIIQLWIAEGILKQRGSQREEEIGDGYLEELIRQSFIQVNTRSTDGSVKTCRISSHVSHLCMSKGAAEEFFEVRKNSNSKPQKHIKRLAIHNDSIMDVMKSFGNCSHAHSLHCFGKSSISTFIRSVDLWRTLSHNFKHLRVLNLGFLELNRVPKDLGKLIHLRYLKLKGSSTTHLPSSIGNLQYLVTLDMRGSHNLLELPRSIWKLKFLRHLYLGGYTNLPYTSGVDYYKALLRLKTLSGVCPNKVLKWLMVRAKFPNVTSLKICSSDRDVTSKFLSSLDHLYHLQALRVENPINLPDLNAFPMSLTKLTLLETKLNRASFKTIEKLSNLRVLKLLKDAIHGEELECNSGAFLQLEVLSIENLALRKWEIGKGALPCLKQLFIKECSINMETIPEDLRRVATFTTSDNEEIERD